ncbi:MAG: hypothetical protein A2Y73_03125 [Chloroflexi bacterium RBG_13_56_8]|nr:MAG: hypothetical protein A2Y73_03125 [Chloroflexi bacterium RBG_13_56_8]
MKVLIGPNGQNLEMWIPEGQRLFPGIEFAYCADRDDLPNQIANADVYMGYLNRDIFLAAKNLKWIQAPSSGVNNYLAIPELAQSDVLLTSASGTHGGTLADHAFAMILNHTRCITESWEYQKKHEYAGRALRPKIKELTGSTIGILGFGAVGRTIAERARGFNMRILAVDLFPNNKPDYVEELMGMDRLDRALKESDYLVVTVPYTPQTDRMLGARQLALMKPDAMLIGISRGKIIDEGALAAALRENRLAAAGLDVFAQEPLPADSELWDVENLLITPHDAGGTQFEGKYILEIFQENLGRLIRGELPLRNQADSQRGF